jgi:AraC family transcriptional regulator of adaptative response/methylated-DNA-[protein]-cysteine methyltransferase
MRSSESIVAFALAPYSSGFVIVAISEQRIRAILLGDSRETLIEELKRQLPDVMLVPDEHCEPALVAKVAALIEDPARAVELPLDIRGTPFQRRVWQALKTVPAGTTVSYAALARQIGAPTSVRAVARAVAANSLAVAIPCHRVIRSNGELSGYRWGADRKRDLLEHEARI